MPFPTSSNDKRSAVIAERERKAKLDALERAQREREEYEIREYLKEHFGDINEDDAKQLWTIVVTLTQALVRQFEEGESELVAGQYHNIDLFYEKEWPRYSDPVYRKERGNLDVIERMAALYNQHWLRCDIGQSFTLERSLRPIPPKSRGRRYDNTLYAKITATAPLPPNNSATE